MISLKTKLGAPTRSFIVDSFDQFFLRRRVDTFALNYVYKLYDYRFLTNDWLVIAERDIVPWHVDWHRSNVTTSYYVHYVCT